MQGYWKFHRKLIEHPVFQDINALKVLLWIFSTVDYKTGKKDTGRFIGAEALKMNPSTFRNALYRLRDKYKIIILKGDNKKTEISVLNWAKYQSKEGEAEIRTTRGQPEDNQNEAKTVKNSSSNSKNIENEDNQRTHYKEIKNKNKNINNIIPATEVAGSEQKEKKERKLTPYQELITYCRIKQGIEKEYVNYPKQTTAVKKILVSGYSLEDIRFVINEMAEDPYWSCNPFDVMSVANQMHKYMNRTVYFKKGGENGKIYSNKRHYFE